MNGEHHVTQGTQQRFSLRIAADKQQLPLLQDFVEQHAPTLRLSTESVYDVLVAITEMVTNSIVHGYAGRPGTIDIEVWTAGHALYTRISDQAPAFDPTSVPAPDTSLPLEQRLPGGMGVHVTRRFMDSIDYRALPQGGNELILIRNHAVVPREP